jgi:hypothetical protein
MPRLGELGLASGCRRCYNKSTTQTTDLTRLWIHDGQADVMEVTTMPGPVSDVELEVEVAFAELVLADDDLLRAEFDELVAAVLAEPPPGDRVRRPSRRGGSGPQRVRPPAPSHVRPRPAARVSRRRNRQRGPP